MKRNKKVLALFSSLLLASVGVIATTAMMGSGIALGVQAGEECAHHSGNHYAMKDPTNTEPGYMEFWACCACNHQYLTKPEGTWTDASESQMVGGVGVGHIAYLPVGLKVPSGENDWALKPLSKTVAVSEIVDKALTFKAYFHSAADSFIQISLYNGNDEYKGAIKDIKIFQTGGKYKVMRDSVNLEADCVKLDEHTVSIKVNYSKLVEASAFGEQPSFDHVRVWPMSEVTSFGCGVFTNSFDAVDPFEIQHKYSFHTAAQFQSMTSEEGENIWIDNYQVGSAEGAVATIAAGGYTHFNSDVLKGLSRISLKGTGLISVKTGTASWSWKTCSYLPLKGEEAVVLDFDPERDNAVIIEGRSEVSLTSIEIIANTKKGTGSTDTDLLQNSSVLNWGIDSYGYYSAAAAKDSKSALVVGSYQQTGWPQTIVDLGSDVDMKGMCLEFDAKGVTGRKRLSITPCDAEGAPQGTEIGWDLTSSWQHIRYDAWTVANPTVKFLKVTTFIEGGHEYSENVIDNLKLVDKGIVTESAGTWAYRSFDVGYALSESDYVGKAVALDFKPETANASFEIDFMSSADFYVGQKNYINVVDGVPTSTFGQIVANPTAGEGWYTLLVSERNISHIDRYSHGTTINGIYIATNDPMSGTVTFNYHSIRAVEDIAPTRQIITYTQAGMGYAFWNTSVVHVTNVNTFRATEGNAIMIGLKATGSVGGTFSFNFAPNGGGEPIIQYVRFTMTEDGLVPSVGKVVYAEDGWCYFYLKNTEVDQTALANAGGDSTLNVFWLGEAFNGIDTVQFDINCYKVYQAGIIE